MKYYSLDEVLTCVPNGRDYIVGIVSDGEEVPILFTSQKDVAIEFFRFKVLWGYRCFLSVC